MTRQENKSKMATIIQNWQESGLSQSEYARTHDIKLVTLRYWILKHRQSSDDRPAFIQLNGISSQDIHIRYPNGVELILPRQASAGLLRTLIHI
jgi:transposase-like protein